MREQNVLILVNKKSGIPNAEYDIYRNSNIEIFINF